MPLLPRFGADFVRRSPATARLRRLMPVASVLTLAAFAASGCFRTSGSLLEATQVAQAAPTFTALIPASPTVEPSLEPSLIPVDEATSVPIYADKTEVTQPPTPEDTGVPTITPSAGPTQTATPLEVAVVASLTGTPSPTATATPSAIVATLNDGTLPTAIILPPYTEVAQLDPLLASATAIAEQLSGNTGIQQQPTLPVDDLGVQSGQPIDPFFGSATALIQTATAEQSIPLTQTAQALFGPTTNPGVPTTGSGPGVITPTFAVITPTFSAPTAGPIASGTDCIHEVQTTDPNLFRISLRYGVTVQDIARASGIVNPNLIYVGQRLVIPGCGTTGQQPPATSVGTVPAIPGGSSPGTGSDGGAIYTVQQGDTLFEISLQYGVTVNAIAAANGISNINLIFIGDQLTIP